jgi:hypothetical protein
VVVPGVPTASSRDGQAGYEVRGPDTALLSPRAVSNSDDLCGEACSCRCEGCECAIGTVVRALRCPAMSLSGIFHCSRVYTRLDSVQ